jgi:hypothetical protein
MKLPDFNIQYHYQASRPAVQIRYGKDREGNYFFDVFIQRHHGGSLCWSSYETIRWRKFSLYLNTLSIYERLKLVRITVRRLKKELTKLAIPILGIRKFKPKTLFYDSPYAF